MGEATKIRACQDLEWLVERTVFNKTMGETYTFSESLRDKICAESREGVRNPKEDAKTRLKVLIAGEKAKCRRDSRCRSIKTVGEVQTEKVKPAWHTRFFAWVSGEGR